jgi:hypothetical protein
MRMRLHWLCLAALASLGCTKKADQCSSNADCTDPAFPFCDVDGAFAASGGTKNICTITPPDCPVDVCGCTPNSVTCGSAELTTCNSDGMSVTTTPCLLGCGSGNACATFTPSNNLAQALATASSAPLIEFPPGAAINTDTGDVQGATVNSTVVDDGAVSIRVFVSPTFMLEGLSLSGTLAVAFVASGTITVSDTLQFSGLGGEFIQVPGQAPATASCVGGTPTISCGQGCQPGIGGGGGATAGGQGGNDGTTNGGSGGLAVTGGFEPLIGGCSSVVPTNSEYDGGGGGAVQLVSATAVQLDGIIDVAGGGGQTANGGGAGGTVVIEAPSVVISATGGLTANGGGGGGGCGVHGANASAGTTAAAGGVCSDASLSGGAGGTGTTLPQRGGNGVPGDASGSGVSYGGGGGSVGRARIATADGTMQQAPAAIMSIVVTSDTLAAH